MDDKRHTGELNYTSLMNGYPPLVVEKKKKHSYDTAICIGDAVVENSAGQVETGNSITPGESYYSGVSLNHGAANQETRHLVLVSPTAVFDCPIDTDDPSFCTSHQGEYSNLEIKDGIERQSQHRLDASTVTDDEEKDMLIIGPSPLGEILNIEGDRPRVLVIFNKHRYTTNRVRVATTSRDAARPRLFSDKRAFDKIMKIAFRLADGISQTHIAYEIDRLLNKGSSKFDARQLRKQCQYFHPDLDWNEIVVIFSP